MGSMPAEPQLQALETAYLAARDAADAAATARATDDTADHPTLDAVAAARSAEARSLLAGFTDRTLTGLDAEDRRVLEAIRDGLADTDETRTAAGQPAPPPPGDRAAWGALVRGGGPALLATLEAAFAATASSLPAPGGPASRLTILARLAAEPDAARRRELFAALAPLWDLVNANGDGTSPYRRIIADAAPGWRAGAGSLARNAAALGIDRRDVETWALTALAAWRAAVVEPAKAAGRPPMEPWDWWWHAGAAERACGTLPSATIRDVACRVLVACGADPDELGISIDTEPRAGRPPLSRATTLFRARARLQADGTWAPARVVVLGELGDGGLDELSELMHVLGHATTMAAIRTRPAFAEEPESDALSEGFADLLAFDVAEPAWQRRWLPGGVHVDATVSLRSHYAATALDAAWALFEMRLLADPARDPNGTWTELTSTWLGIAPHPEWSWWAIRGQLVQEPGYMANYPLGAVLTTELRAAIRERRGDWTEGDPGWYPWVREHLLRFGRERRPEAIVRDLLGRPPTADALLEQIARAAPPPRVV